MLLYRLLSTFLILLVWVESHEVDKCKETNPIYGCFMTAQKAITYADKDVPAYCRAVQEYINCTETVACDCQLGHNSLVLQQITQYVQLYKYYNCSKALTEELNTDPGINCPGQIPTGSDTNAGLLVLSLDTLPNVVMLEQLCPGIKTCYTALSDVGGTALYNKDLKAYCGAIEEFLPCFETTTCRCQHTKTYIFETTVKNERNAYNSVCSLLTQGVYFKAGVQCTGDIPLDVCKETNPLYDCYSDLDLVNRANPSDKSNVCPAYKRYLNCTERTACRCGLKNSVPVLQGLTFAHDAYNSKGCETVSGKVEIKAGINCPAGSPNSGSVNDEILTSIGIMNNPEVVRLIEQCNAIEICYKMTDATTSKALYEKNAVDLCRSQRNFIHCAEQAGCQCKKYADRKYQLLLLQQKKVHNNLCKSDRLSQYYACGASTVFQISVTCVLLTAALCLIPW